MLKIEATYINYDEKIHKQFPNLISCKVYDKNAIINVDLRFTQIINDINCDVGYDSHGRYISVSIGQWHHNISGEYISENDFFELDDVYDYDYVEYLLKLYTKESYKVHIHNFMDRNIKISLIPVDMLEFSCTDSNLIFNL